MPESPLFDIPMLEGGSDFPTPDATADVAQINAQFVYMEQFLGVKPVTSGTLPSLPKTQQTVVETDTGKLKYWDGAAWVDVIPDGVRAGTTALRNLIYPAPANAAARVALANRCVRWHNTETGFIEQYFCDDADSGQAGYNFRHAVKPAGGWYPVDGRLPWVLVEKNIAQNTIDGIVTVTWNNSAEVEGTDDSMYVTGTNTRLIAPIRGHYNIRGRISTNDADVALSGNIYRNGSAYNRGKATGIGHTGSGAELYFDTTVFADAGDYFEFKVTATSVATIEVGSTDSTWAELRYLHPEWVKA